MRCRVWCQHERCPLITADSVAIDDARPHAHRIEPLGGLDEIRGSKADSEYRSAVREGARDRNPYG
jgi:hypothetical protein